MRQGCAGLVQPLRIFGKGWCSKRTLGVVYYGD